MIYIYVYVSSVTGSSFWRYSYFDVHWRSLTYWDPFHCFFSWLIGHLLTISPWHPHRLATAHLAKYMSGKLKQRNIMNIFSGRWAVGFNDWSFGRRNYVFFAIGIGRWNKKCNKKGIQELGWIDDNTASSDSFHGQSDFILTPGIRIVLDPSRSWNLWGLWPSMRLIQSMRQWRLGSSRKWIQRTLNHRERSVPRSLRRGTMSSPRWRCIVLWESQRNIIHTW